MNLTTLLIVSTLFTYIGNNSAIFHPDCTKSLTQAVTIKAWVNQYSKGEPNFHFSKTSKNSLYLFDQTHGTFCGLIVDTVETTCAKEMEWINSLSDKEIRMYAILSGTEISFGLRDQIQKGWNESKVSAVWGGQVKIVYEIDNSKCIEYENNRTVFYRDGIVESYLDLK